MWDFKLIFLEWIFFFNLIVLVIIDFLLDLITPVFFQSFYILNWIFSTQFTFNSSSIFGIKFCLCISFLILIRGGTPRYRYDYLTKLGWLKFLTLILLAFFSSMLLFFIF